MVSNARLDLPEPERPVTTIRRSRGSSTEMFLRLWTRAPWTAIVVRAAARFRVPGAAPRGLFVGIVEIVSTQGKEGELLYLNVTSPGQLDRQGRLADEPAIGEVLARG